MVDIKNMDCLEMLAGIKTGTIDLVFADPPFNVNYQYNGFKDVQDNYEAWCCRWIAECFRVLKDTGSFYLMTLPRHLPFILSQWRNMEFF